MEKLEFYVNMLLSRGTTYSEDAYLFTLEIVGVEGRKVLEGRQYKKVTRFQADEKVQKLERGVRVGIISLLGYGAKKFTVGELKSV